MCYTSGRTPLTFVTFGRCLKPIRLHLPCFRSVLTSRVQSPTWPWFSRLCDLSALLDLVNASCEWRFYSCSSVSTSNCYGACLRHVVTAFTLSLCSTLRLWAQLNSHCLPPLVMPRGKWSDTPRHWHPTYAPTVPQSSPVGWVARHSARCVA